MKWACSPSPPPSAWALPASYPPMCWRSESFTRPRRLIGAFRRFSCAAAAAGRSGDGWRACFTITSAPMRRPSPPAWAPTPSISRSSARSSFVTGGGRHGLLDRPAAPLQCASDFGISRRAPARHRSTPPTGPGIYTGGPAWEFQWVPGDEFPVFDTAHGKVGLAMCSEVYMPEVSRALALRGAELIFMPAGKDKGKLWATWRTLIWARAIENLAIVVTTQNLFDHSERGLAMVASPEEILFESTIAGTTVVDVS